LQDRDLDFPAAAVVRKSFPRPRRFLPRDLPEHLLARSAA